MKRILFLLIILLPFSGYTQKRVIATKQLRNQAVTRHQIPTLVDEIESNTGTYVKSVGFEMEEEQIGDTRYDNQSNASIPNRIYYYDDGTIAATWTRSMDESSFFADRGTGYNYFDGVEWDEWPMTRIEDIKTHRPSYAPWGPNGEISVTHVSEVGLYFSTRTQKGTGTWEFTTFGGPPGNDYILWNRVMTSGANRDRVHLLTLTLPTSHGGFLYQGLDGALLYSLSVDGGTTWDIENEILEGLESDEYTGFEGDTYAFAEPKDDIVAFAVGGSWYDLFLMKSENGGETFDKTIIWEHPYPFWQLGTQTDTFYCADGSHHLVIDDDGTVHVVFGINRALADDVGTYWFPFVDGIAYWNENMSGFSNDVNALSPYGDPGSELEEDYNLIGWSQDVNGNGQLDFTGEMGFYYIGLSSMPQLILDDMNRLFMVYSSVTETYDNGTKNYRHLWARASDDGGVSWYHFTDLTSDLIHIFDECVYPSCAPKSDENIYLVYQTDTEPGTATWGAQHPYVDNKTMFIKAEKADFLITGNEEAEMLNFDVSQNFPNPFSTFSEIKVKLNRATDLQLEIVNLAGQKIYSAEILGARPGMNTLSIDGSEFSPGVYFYTVKAGESSVTKKMIVE